MVVYFGGLKKAKEMYYGGHKIKEAWYGGERVFSGKPVEVMPATPGVTDARDWLRAKLTEYGESYETVKELPFDIDASRATGLAGLFEDCQSLTTVPPMDTSQVTDMRGMFQRCESLTTVPEMDTRNVTDMAYMFNGCYALTEAPAMDTSQVTDMRVMFSGCSSLISVPDMDTRRVRRARQMFDGCASLTDGSVRLIGRHPYVDTGSMIANSGLTREPFYDSSGRPI